MAKIAFNNSCGGFHLSDKAVQAYINASVQALRKTIPSDHAIRYGEIARHDPILISVIEQLGKDASAEGSEIRIREVPGDLYRIDTYDGNEEVFWPTENWIYAGTGSV